MSRRKKKGASDPQVRGTEDAHAAPFEALAESTVDGPPAGAELDGEPGEVHREDDASETDGGAASTEASLDGESGSSADDGSVAGSGEQEEGEASGSEPADTESEPEVAVGNDGVTLEKILEAVLFSAAAPVPVAKLARAFEDTTKEEIVAALGRLAEGLTAADRGIRLVETGSGWQLLTAVDCASYVRRFFAEKPPRLSRALLETLAIVAYRQPATRGEVEAVRGVDCDAILTALLTRGLVQVVGRRHAPGRPVEFGTTAEFLELFSMRDLEELPPLPDADSLAALVAEVAGNVDLGPDGELEDAGETSEGDEPEEGSEIDGATAEDLESGGDRLEASGGGSDPGGSGPGEREGGVDTGDQGGSGPGPDHG